MRSTVHRLAIAMMALSLMGLRAAATNRVPYYEDGVFGQAHGLHEGTRHPGVHSDVYDVGGPSNQ
jgi:hypothetical protein